MAESLILAQVCLAADTTIPADLAVNTFHFTVDPEVDAGPDLTIEQVITGERPLATDENGIHGDLSDLYVAIENYISVNVDIPTSVVKYINLSDPAPRIPLLELPFDPAPDISSSGLPSEVAICSSFEAAKVSGVNQARRRNRVFLGPLSLGTIVGPPYGVVHANVRTVIADAFENFALNSETQAHWTWVVYSPTDDLTHNIANGWVDDAFDTQRRRGQEPTVRTNWTQVSGTA
uniref:Uncharacterized protein n=1 Tax=uncultured prokaryote TaxID=198431 RepID=A0A0H5Q3J3_9ZZZZ|nr:hypothetical protein [uncultured prokaryote]